MRQFNIESVETAVTRRGSLDEMSNLDGRVHSDDDVECGSSVEESVHGGGHYLGIQPGASVLVDVRKR